MNGYEFVKQVKKNNPKVKVILTSATAAKPDRPKEFAATTEPNTAATVNAVSEKGFYKYLFLISLIIVHAHQIQYTNNDRL
jgi:CheY-like chemotaxis protein